MTRTLWPGVLAAAVAAGLAAPARSAEDKSPSSYAVVVGAGEFADPQIKARPTAAADAKAIHALLTDKKYLGVPAGHVKLLTGKEATRENVLKALRWVADAAGKDDLVFVAMIGNGAEAGERNCFFTADTVYKDRIKTAVSSADIEHDLEKLKSQKFVALLDVNFKGFDAGKESAIEPNPREIVTGFVGPEDKEEHALPPGRLILLANREGVAAPLEVGGHGLFTKVVTDALKGAADKEGYEPDGNVTVDELIEHLHKQLPALAREYGTSKAQKEQLPFVFGSRASHYVLTRNPAVAPKADARLAKLKQLAAEGKVKPDAAGEGEKLLERMPKLKAQQELRKQYVKLVDGELSAADFAAARGKILAGTKIERADADLFARKVMAGVSTIRREYVKDVKQGDMVAWAVKGMFERVDAKIPGEIKDKLDDVGNLRDRQLTELLADAREVLGKREDLDGGKDVDVALQGMLANNLDPYTTYVSPEELAKFKVEMTGQFSGIGIQIRHDQARDGLLVVTPILGSPAYKAGLKAGDLVTQIYIEADREGKPLPADQREHSTKGMKTEDAVKLILGKPGTKIRLTVEREGVKEPLTFEINRNKVQTETVLGVKRKSDDTWDYLIDPDSKIAYVRLTQFGPRSAEDVEKAVKELDSKGIKGLVFDMRGNPGGLLTAAVKITDLFIDDGLIVTIRPRVGSEQSYGGERDGSYLNFPMVVLVNGGSASGSEIVAAALQDHKRAVVMGERSYGKGSVQNIQEFRPTGGEIKLTTASFWRPNGKNLNKSSVVKDGQKLSAEEVEKEDWGVRPDAGYEVKLAPKDRLSLYEHLRDNEVIPRRDAPPAKEAKPEFKDQQLEAALKYLREQIRIAQKTASKKAGG